VELRGLGYAGLAGALTFGVRLRREAAALGALLLLTLLRLYLAAETPLSPDEAYYWVWSRALAPGYLDHPPMVALWVRAGTALAGATPLGVRLLGPLSAALGSLLLADAAQRLMRLPGAGIAAAALLNATLLFGVGTVIMTPDTPLLFFWTAALWTLARLAEGGRAAWFVPAGLCIGLAMASKYTGLMLALGAGLWVLLLPAMRRFLGTPWPWAGGAAALLPVAPVIWWNAENGWASFAKQGGRAADFNPARAAQFLAELVFGQMGLATPLVFVLCAVGLATAARRMWLRREPRWSLLALLGLPSVLLFLQHALGDRVQGNWPAIVYPAGVVAAAGLTKPRWRRLLRPAVALGLAMTLAVYAQALWRPLPPPLALPPARDPIALQLGGWPGFAAEVEAARARAGAEFVAAESYGLASQLAFLLSPGVKVIALEPRWALFRLPPGGMAGRAGLLVQSTKRREPPDPADWYDVTPAGVAARTVRGAEVEGYRMYRAVLRTGASPAALMPSR